MDSKIGPEVKLGFWVSARCAKECQSIKAKHKRYTGAFKAKVGLEALMGIKTVGQIAREYGFIYYYEACPETEERSYKVA